MAKAKTPTQSDAPISEQTVSLPVADLASALAAATTAAIESARPLKKNVFTRVRNTPWTPKDGSAKLKFKRKTHHHGILLNEKLHSNEEIALFNKLRPGTFCDGFVKVTRRRDKGIDLDYPVKTASQRLRLSNQYGITNLVDLLTRCINEAANPKKVEIEDLD